MKRKQRKREGKWNWIIDVFLFITELLLTPIRLLVRGILGLLKN
ncbi:hypothetical protein [Desertibacillus haloalkaliphilus]|nr:hypothetical protein [Desertibacillus haloalkaliphilus]